MPLIIGLPGSFDSADYTSYRSWMTYLPDLGADVRVLDMLQLPGVRQIDATANGATYYCEWQPEDYLDLIVSTIAEVRPSKVVLLGFGSGTYEAMRSALALTALGLPIAGIVGIAPHAIAHQVRGYHGSDNPVEHPEVEFCEDRLSSEIQLLAGRDANTQLLSCVRYEDLHSPPNGAKNTFYMPAYTLQQYKGPLNNTLKKQLDHVKHLDDAGGILRTPRYTVPTTFIATADSWYVPPTQVGALARRSKLAQTSYIELPGVCYDFRAFQSQVDRVTETVMDKVGQLLTTGTVNKPRPSHTFLVRPERSTGKTVGTIVLSSARPAYHHRFAVQLAKEAGADLAVLASHDMRGDIVAADMRRAGLCYRCTDHTRPSGRRGLCNKSAPTHNQSHK